MQESPASGQKRDFLFINNFKSHEFIKTVLLKVYIIS